MISETLFIICINDIVKCSNDVTFAMYADDTSVFASGGNLHDTAAVRVNSGLSAIYRWMPDNKLTLNVDKSCYMVFRRHRGNINDGNTISIKIDDRDLTQVNHVR